MRIVGHLDRFSRADAPRIGAKAANLAELAAAGFRVPPGFVVTLGDPGAPDEGFQSELGTALVALAAEHVAVRSSAVGEDSRVLSHAGAFRTVTDVDATGDGGPGRVAAAIEVVMASMDAHSAQLVAYRHAVLAGQDAGHATGHGDGHESGHDAGQVAEGVGADMAVLVQAMVSGRYSGVAFSDDPMGRREAPPDTGARVLVEVVDGPGAGLVDGTANPYRFRLAPSDLAARRCVPTGPGSEPVGQVVRTVTEIRDHLGMEVDVEWCWERGILHVLQARPVTGSSAVRVPLTVPPEGTTVLRGEPASPGAAEGVARVLGDPSVLDLLDEGEILVTRFTSPEWMPALLRCAAVVTEVGGVTSHAAIISRELGVPCVVGAVGACDQVASGEWIHVDGAAGIVSRR